MREVTEQASGLAPVRINGGTFVTTGGAWQATFHRDDWIGL